MPRTRTTITPVPLGQGVTVYHRVDESLVVSEGHRRAKGQWREGGPFYQVTDRRTTTPSARIRGSVSGTSNSTFDARVAPGQSPRVTPAFRTYPSWDSKSSEASGLGATGFKRARPGQPGADVFTFVGELRDGLPSVPLRLLTRLRGFRGAGSEYLNAQFGWMPMVRDIQKMYQTYRDLDKRLSQLRRDNGHGIRRRRELVNSTTVSTTSSGSSAIPFVGVGPQPFWTGLVSGKSNTTTTVEVLEHAWFVGRFRYYIPDVGTSQWTRRATRALFGVNPTPEGLWNLLPWSWLIDWFGNVGDVLSNLSSNAAENCIADYAYVMRTTTRRTKTECTGSWNSWFTTGQTVANVPAGSYACSFVDELTTKARVGADPYGFNVGFGGLSAYQASILAALGVSRR